MTSVVGTRWPLAALAVGLAAIAGCGDDAPNKTPAKPAASQPASVTISAESTGAKTAQYEMPASIKAGLTQITFTNNAKGPREADLVRVEGDHTVKEVLAVVNDQGGAKIPDWIHAEGGVSTVMPGASSTSVQVLAPGSYYMTDSADPDSGVKPAKPFQFEVTGAPSGAALPKAPAQITAREYGYTFSGLKAGKNEVHFQNTGKELHHALFFGEAAGATRAQVLKYFTSQGKVKGKPPIDFSTSSATTVLDGGTEQNTELDLKPGKYAIVCFLTDRAGGPPHIAKGMFAEVTVK
jgi:hypothetical protein